MKFYTLAETLQVSSQTSVYLSALQYLKATSQLQCPGFCTQNASVQELTAPANPPLPSTRCWTTSGLLPCYSGFSSKLWPL